MFYRSLARRTPLLVAILAAVILAATLAACKREPAPPVDRLALLPFENLTPDPAFDWISRAAPVALAHQLAGAGRVQPVGAGSAPEAYAAHADQFLHVYFTRANGDLQMYAALEARASLKTIRAIAVHGPESAGPLPLLAAIARWVSPEVRPFSTANAAAFETFGGALLAPDPETQSRRFDAATQADPAFAAAYVVWAETLVARGDRAAAAARVSRAGLTHAPESTERARLEYLAATAAADPAGRERALEALSRLTPSDSEVFRLLGELRQAARRFPAAVASLQEAARLNPGDPALYNLLGYAQAFAGNLAAARASLNTYAKLSPPGSANALDSLGEVSFYLRDFAGAAAYFEQAHDRNPRETGGLDLLKAAQARLFAGDLAAADAVFARYAAYRKPLQPALTEFQQAQWQFLTGRRKRALAALEARLPAFDPDASAYALVQLSMWKLQTGDRPGAVAAARQAAARATSPAARSLGAMAQFIADAGSASGSPAADAYALLLAGKFDQALPPLRAVYGQTSPSTDGQARTLLAWAAIRTGHFDEARPLLTICPIPLTSGEEVFASLEFPRLLYLNGAMAAHDGKAEDARRSFQLFKQFSGDTPDTLDSDRTVAVN